MENAILWLTIMPYILIGLTLFIFTLTWIIPEAINDSKWYAYMDAYDEWTKNGRRGKLPEPKDFGYKNHS